jgi:CBS-domain-containing membrane protein
MFLGNILRVQVHRLVVVDDAGTVQGIISLSDILHHLVIQPLGEFQFYEFHAADIVAVL